MAKTKQPSAAQKAAATKALLETLTEKADVFGLTSADVAAEDQNIFDKAADFLRKLATKLEGVKPGWILRWLVPDLPKVIDEVVDVLNALADALDKYGENDG